jgi:hypothetical protein
MLWVLRLFLHSLTVIFTSSVHICWAYESLAGTGGGMLGVDVRVVVMGVMVAAVGVEVVDLQTFKFEQLGMFCELEFFRNVRAMWSWVLHQKLLPLALYFACSLSVSLWNRTVILAESMSIGTK